MTSFFVKPRSQDELAGLAHDLLKKWSALKDCPIDIEHYLEKYQSVKVIPSTQIAPLCNMGGAVSQDGSVIYVDPNDYVRNPFRLRMTIAHEFSHSKLHSTIFSLLRSEKEVQELLAFFTKNPQTQSQYEIQAFTLAGYLLVPEETLEKIVREVTPALEEAMRVKAGRKLDMTSEGVWRIIASQVARRYEVTPPAATKRLKWAKLWGKPLPG